MLTKRDFNKGLGLAGFLSGLPALSLAKPLNAEEFFNVDIALFDPRYKSSHLFAEKVGLEGAKIISTNLDVGSLWEYELKQVLNETNSRISGLTPHADIFLLKALASPCGYQMQILQKFETFEPHIDQINQHASEDYLVEIKGETVTPVHRELFAWVLVPLVGAKVRSRNG